MLAALLLGLTATQAVSPYDQRIEYIGRFDQRDPRGPRGAWPAVEAKLVVKGSGLLVTVDDVGPDWLQVVVDGEPTRAVQLMPGTQTLEVQAPSLGIHTYELVKRTEAQVGVIQFLEFEAEGKLLQARRPKRLIEIIGDAVACGYGNEATSERDPFRPATENSFLSYGSLAARRCGAAAQIIAYSGKKMWPDNPLPSVYDLNLPADPSSNFDFKAEEPQAIVIHLGSTDLRGLSGDDENWVGAYKAFVERLRFHYPDAVIYAAYGGSPADAESSARSKANISKVVELMSEQGDKKTHLLAFDDPASEEGLGADGHPSLATHERMAILLEIALKHDLRW